MSTVGAGKDSSDLIDRRARDAARCGAGAVEARVARKQRSRQGDLDSSGGRRVEHHELRVRPHRADSGVGNRLGCPAEVVNPQRHEVCAAPAVVASPQGGPVLAG